jgi:DNA helicase-2/ATP-dependent DNA helicase PcrA
MTFRPRPKQEEVLAYRGGKMAIAAVPGSGKTATLSYLAAKLVAEAGLDEDQEVLIVTFANSAVDHFARQVGSFVRERGLLPNLGYHVCTLHSLAHEIVRERPGLVGLAEDFAILDEGEAGRILQEATATWLRTHPNLAEDYLDPLLSEQKRREALAKGWPDLIKDVAVAVVRRAKDFQLEPEQLQEMIAAYGQKLPLLQAGCDIYADYQRALAYRGAVDFDDLIRLALGALQLEPHLRERLHHRWPYVLEDEAQDSSRLQEEILRLLVGPDGNWVRVGDPNQAIYDSFTTANPRYLRTFLEESGVQRRELPNSGRSTLSIIRLANHLIDWARQEHPVEELRDALTLPHIEPTPPGDAQPNPTDAPERVFLSTRLRKPQDELRKAAESLARYIQQEPDASVAALVPTNGYGAKLVQDLRELGVPYVELLRTTVATRDVARLLARALAYLADPTAQSKLTALYSACHHRLDGEGGCDPQAAVQIIRRCPHLEDFLHPGPGGDWLEQAALEPASPVRARLTEFRTLVSRWQEAVVLPPDQLVLTLAQDLFDEPADLAVAHRLAVHLGHVAQANPDWRLPELHRELESIARNERRFVGLSDDDTGFDPEQHRGKVVVATIHKAKGLEWDRVHLLSANCYDFPSAQSHDTYRSEKRFIRDRLNLQAEVEAQLEHVVGELRRSQAVPSLLWEEEAGPGTGTYVEGKASQEARLRYCAERLRLLYVGITRARKELIVTCNSGRFGDMRPASPLIALHAWWEENGHASSS